MFLLVECDRRTEGRTDTTEYKDARTHLKRKIMRRKEEKIMGRKKEKKDRIMEEKKEKDCGKCGQKIVAKKKELE